MPKRNPKVKSARAKRAPVVKTRRTSEMKKPFDAGEYFARLKRLPPCEPGNFDRSVEL